jgi:ubiquinone/menaquinone biosynthesis C-methylase UbiE
MTVIELGCGLRKAEGAIGLDINPRSDADVLCDLESGNLPLRDSSVDKVLACDVLEHVDNFVAVVEEIWRILKPGGILEVSAPFMSSVNYFSDPTHRRAFTSMSFDYFISGTNASRYRYSDVEFELLSVEYDKYEYDSRSFLNRMILKWANANKQRYESRYAFLFPVYQIYFELRVIK